MDGPLNVKKASVRLANLRASIRRGDITSNANKKRHYLHQRVPYYAVTFICALQFIVQKLNERRRYRYASLNDGDTF
jgi:hypothetical protein